MSHVFLVVSAALGVGTVPVVSLLKGRHWPTELKFALALVLSGVAALTQTAVAGHLNNLSDLMAAFATTIAAGQTFYQTWFGGTTFEAALKRVGPIAREVTTAVNTVAPVAAVALEGNAKAQTVVADVTKAVNEVAPAAPAAAPVITAK